MTDRAGFDAAWGQLLFYYPAIVILLLLWGFTRHRDKTDVEGNIVRHGQPLSVTFRPFFLFIGGMSFVFLLPGKIQDYAVQAFVIGCGLCLFVVVPIVGAYLCLREYWQKRQEEIDAAMAFDKSPVHGTAGIASPDQQRQAGL
jgi:hypothetical protein